MLQTMILMTAMTCGQCPPPAQYYVPYRSSNIVYPATQYWLGHGESVRSEHYMHVWYGDRVGYRYVPVVNGYAPEIVNIRNPDGTNCTLYDYSRKTSIWSVKKWPEPAVRESISSSRPNIGVTESRVPYYPNAAVSESRSSDPKPLPKQEVAPNNEPYKPIFQEPPRQTLPTPNGMKRPSEVDDTPSRVITPGQNKKN